MRWYTNTNTQTVIFHPGYSDDPRRLNVLLTRAKIGLVVVGHRQTLETSSLWQSWLEQAPNLSLADVEKIAGPSGHPPRGPSGGPTGRPSNGPPRGSSGKPSTHSSHSGEKDEKKKGGTKAKGTHKGPHESKEGFHKDCNQSTKIFGPERVSTLPSPAKPSPKIGGLVRSPGDGLAIERKKVN